MTLAGCNKKDEVLPLIESTFCLVEGKTSIYLGSIIHSEGSSQVKSRGVCWDTDSMPTIYNDHTTDGSGGCEFNSRITGLNPGTKYFIRSYARSKIGTSLSVEWSVTTQRDPCAPVVTTSNSSVSAHDGGNISNDGGSLISVHGNNYNVALIGSQMWMADNLKTTKYRDGADIPNVTDYNTWPALKTPAYCWYNNDAISYKSVYGPLYNWYSVNNGMLCPDDGWHVATDSEWQTLVNYVGGGFAIKLGTFGTNDFSFSAVTCGELLVDVMYNGFMYMGAFGHYWTATELTVDDAQANLFNGMDYKMSSVDNISPSKRSGLSVRCLHD